MKIKFDFFVPSFFFLLRFLLFILVFLSFFYPYFLQSFIFLSLPIKIRFVQPITENGWRSSVFFIIINIINIRLFVSILIFVLEIGTILRELIGKLSDPLGLENELTADEFGMTVKSKWDTEPWQIWRDEMVIQWV